MRIQVAVGEPVELQYQRAYDRYSVDVFRFLLAWTNEWATAEDLTQETFLRLWQHRASFDWDRPVLAWLLVTARHLATSRFRALRRRLLPAASNDISDESVRVRWLDVRQALAGLTPLERTALILTAIEGWSYADLAGVFRTTEGALRSAVSRARDKLEAA